MKLSRKVICIVGVGIVSVLLTATSVYACCGIYASIVDDPIPVICLGQDVTISGTITGLNGDPGIPSILTGEIDEGVAVEITTPSGDVIGPVEATLSNYQLDPGTAPSIPGTITYDFSLTYTPTELGTYTYVKTVRFITAYPWTNETDTATGSFEVERCLALDIKGGSCPNPLNRNGKGGTPVAILGIPEVLAEIDLSSLTLGGIAPMVNKDGTIMMTLEDSTEPGDYDPADCYDCFEAPPTEYDAEGNIIFQYEGDGTDELVLKFDLRDVEGDPGDCVELTLTGFYLDGDPIVLSDSMVIVK